jgi:hypothetical protein
MTFNPCNADTFGQDVRGYRNECRGSKSIFTFPIIKFVASLKPGENDTAFSFTISIFQSEFKFLVDRGCVVFSRAGVLIAVTSVLCECTT